LTKILIGTIFPIHLLVL